jgi:hypothetical protein
MSCKKVIVVAEEMKNMFGEKINLSIFTTDSEEARKYAFRSSTNVMFENDLIPLEISLDKQKMKNFLSERLS